MKTQTGSAKPESTEGAPADKVQGTAKGILNQQLADTAVATSQTMQALVGQGFNHYETWEAHGSCICSLVEESGGSEKAPVCVGLMAMRELNESLRYFGMTDEEIEISKALDE